MILSQDEFEMLIGKTWAIKGFISTCFGSKKHKEANRIANTVGKKKNQNWIWNGTGATGKAEKLPWRLEKGRWTEESVLPKANIL